MAVYNVQGLMREWNQAPGEQASKGNPKEDIFFLSKN